MGDLTRNISRHEVKCKCGYCDCDTLDYLTAAVVQECVDHFAKLEGKPVFIHITSGHRCEDYNLKVGGETDSQHLVGRAVDFYLYTLEPTSQRIISPERVYDYLDKRYSGRYGVGRYSMFTHLDTKTGYQRRWIG